MASAKTGRAASLRAVAPDEKAPVREKPLTVTEAATVGTRELLVATRDRIAVAVENPNTPARDLAALTKRLMETVRELESLSARESEGAGGIGEVGDGEFNAEAI